jgi:hypothetical protein
VGNIRIAQRGAVLVFRPDGDETTILIITLGCEHIREIVGSRST